MNSRRTWRISEKIFAGFVEKNPDVISGVIWDNPWKNPH